MRLRGRKGIREEIESQKHLVILDPQIYRNQWTEIFGNKNPIHIELGMGKGRFISEMSVKNPHINYIGIDMYDELIRKASEKARTVHQVTDANGQIPNLRIVRMNIEHIEKAFAENEIERIYLNFSDPWPKKRHAARRLTHRIFLEKYAIILQNNGEIHMKTDSSHLFEFSLNSFSHSGFQLRDISLHLHEERVRDEFVLTEYEMKFVERGLNIYRCEAHKCHKRFLD